MKILQFNWSNRNFARIFVAATQKPFHDSGIKMAIQISGFVFEIQNPETTESSLRNRVN